MDTPTSVPASPLPNRTRSRSRRSNRPSSGRKRPRRKKRRQLSPEAILRRRKRRIAFWIVSVLVIFLSFGASFFWQRLQIRRLAAASETPPVTEEQRASARRSLDNAVRARHAERMDEAVAQLALAQQADPSLPGLELLVGEIALQQRDTDALRRASANALQRGDNEASAKLLAALEVWLRRGVLGVQQAGPRARQFLLEAAESDPSDGSIHFFHGELSRQLGDSSAAHAYLLSALRRQSPWKSSSLLQVKMQLAAAEAAEAGETVEVPAPDPQSAAALRWREALRTGTRAGDARGAMIALTPGLQTSVLLDDPALQAGDNTIEVKTLRIQLGNAVTPGGMLLLPSP